MFHIVLGNLIELVLRFNRYSLRRNFVIRCFTIQLHILDIKQNSVDSSDSVISGQIY